MDPWAPIYKLNANGVKGKLLRWIKHYLTNREQTVVVDGTYSSWAVTKAGVPQGSVLGPLLFLIFINDLTVGIKSNVKLFADDTMLYVSVENAMATAKILNNDHKMIEQSSKKWLVTFNANKTECVLFSLKPKGINHPPLYLNSEEIKEVESHTHLGLTLSCNGKWDQHISNIVANVNYSLNAMRRLKYFLDKGTLEKIYFAYVRPIMEYSTAVRDNCTIAQSTKLEQLQLDAARITTGAVKGTKHMLLYNETGWQTLSERRENSQLSIMYKMLNNLVPNYLSLLVYTPWQNHYVLRDNKRIPTIYAKTNIYMNSFLPRTVSNLNALPDHTKLATSPESFKNKINK